MIRREQITSTEFPERSVEIADIDHITGRVPDLDSIADAIRRADENVNPAEKTGNGRLHRQTHDE